ncbi:hypothetical protein C2S53_020112 [Perilla frutescens var. hirtella]|uniref:Ubiquitin-like protease family profile domain-containing protein n=1 Tax=Perilla frutescens var. hirtella TaxID=608512 RepID=A0AAD4ILH9_PERFH|nr:hypothetical protein C2S53_020112 [Perilla frutescens var. hirtella]
MTSHEDLDPDGSGVDIENDSSGSKSTRANKGRVYLDKLAVLRAKGIKKDVSFNDRGQPIVAVGAEMQSYIGVLTRQYIKVSYKHWNGVPAEAKNFTWDNVTSTPDMLYDPPPACGILKEDWKTFVISRMSEEFQKVSQEQKERRRKNLYPHHLSRKGYAGLREQMKDKLTGDEEIDRAMLWKQARANKKGEFEGEHLTRTIIKIDEFTQQKKGVFCSQHPTQDILIQALETPEHCGRVRAVGGNITPTIYFNLTRGMSSVGKMQEMSRMMIQMNAKIMELENYIKSKDSEEKGSCSVKNNNDIRVIDDEVKIAKVKAKAAHIVKVEGSKGKTHVSPMSNTRDLREANMPKTLKLLYSYSRHALNNGSSIAIRLDDDVFGCELNLFIFIEDVYNLCEFEPISAGCICVYLCFHWIMTVIDPHRETVYLLDPLSHQNRDEQWKHAVDMAIRIFNTSISKKGRKNPLWEIIKSPRQPDSKQCGFYIMRYMKDIVEACRSSKMISLHSLFAGGNYSRNELDEVRAEWAECLQDYVI